MKTSLFISAIFLFALILGSCKNGNNKLQEDDNSSLKKKPVERPFEISAKTTGKFIPPGPESLCGEEIVTLTLEGRGHATHMGDVKIVGHHCFQGPCIWGPLDFTAENGDILYTRCGEGEDGSRYILCQKNPITNKGPGLIVGGTGRFEGATGKLTWTITVVNDSAFINAVGVIIY